MDVAWIDRTTPESHNPKAAGLMRLVRAGVRVPTGFVLELGADPTGPSIRPAIERLLADGPVIVRSALAGEDGEEGSTAGLGRSIANCRRIEDVEAALEAILEHTHDPWVARYRENRIGDLVRDEVIIQRQVPRAWLVAVVVEPDGSAYGEAHSCAGDPLSSGASPDYAGPLTEWSQAPPELAEACREAVAVLSPANHGVELEVVIDPLGVAHVVQARRLLAPLHPGWNAFAAAVERSGPSGAMVGSLVLDAEHNPSPLSPAHAWLIDELRAKRPDAGGPRTLAGWLYVEILPRDLGKPQASGPGHVGDLLRELRDVTLPRTRARVESLSENLERADSRGVALAIGSARELFLETIAVYVDVLIPARVAAVRAGARQQHVTASPLSLRGRESFLDVLPATWDVASPTLADLLSDAEGRRQSLTDDDIPDDVDGAVTLLGEWDDHLFALGLAPMRRVYLRASDLLRLGPERGFLLRGDELALALEGALERLPELLEARAADQALFAMLTPPPRIHDGRPLPSVGHGASAWLRGLPLGSSFEGPLAPRRDLAHLLAEPPAPDAIVVLPTLTAQSAIVMHELGVRAVCSEHGGAMSHATLIARELGLSALIGCHGCTELAAGRVARLDTRAGRLVAAPESSSD